MLPHTKTKSGNVCNIILKQMVSVNLDNAIIAQASGTVHRKPKEKTKETPLVCLLLLIYYIIHLLTKHLGVAS